MHISTHQYTSAHISTHQYTSAHISAHQYTSVQVRSSQYKSVPSVQVSTSQSVFINISPFRVYPCFVMALFDYFRAFPCLGCSDCFRVIPCFDLRVWRYFRSVPCFVVILAFRAIPCFKQIQAFRVTPCLFQWCDLFPCRSVFGLSFSIPRRSVFQAT